MTPSLHTERSAADRWIFGATLALLVWLPLPWGSHRPWSADLLVTLSAALLGLRLLAISAGQSPFYSGLARQLAMPLLWWLLWLAWIGSQLWPMDADTLRQLSPEAAQLHFETTSLLGLPTVATISIAPSATVDAWLLSAGYACLYVLIVLSCHRDRGRMGLVLGVLVASGLFQAVYGSLMVLSGLEWGFFEEKRFYRHVATGTFVNRNHLAGYLELAGAAALGLVLADLGGRGAAHSWRQRLLDAIALAFSAKMRARLALVIMAVALVLTRSRMGNIAFFTSLCVCGMGFVLLRWRGYAMRAFLLFSSVIAIDILIVSNWYGLERVVERIERTDLATEGRAIFLDEVPPVIEAYRQVGSGLGTFAYAYAPFRSERMGEYFDHAHNDYIEFMIETGVVGIALLAAFVLAHALHALRMVIFRRRRMAAAVGFSALMGLLAQAIHATAEFNLQIPANAATLLVLLALAASCSSVSERPRPEAPQGTGDGARQMD
ncbi:MAG: O-antigen ligase family protein [Sinimarinibacterium sp.]